LFTGRRGNRSRFHSRKGIRGNSSQSAIILHFLGTGYTMWIYVNDRFLQEESARISVFDHGFLYGDGVYETLRSYGSAIFMRDHHLARLRRSADALGIIVPALAWEALLRESMTLNEVGNDRHDAYIRITLSRGPGDIGLDPALCPVPTLVIM